MMLDERTKQVLFAVIQCYINAPGPVGSRVVTKKFSFGLSPATIRNIMSDLEEMGYLQQPHTSAGRVPTDIGYRYYVDSMRSEKRLINKDFLLELNRKLELLKKDINAFLDEASKMLSYLSHYIGVTMSPNTGITTLDRIELIKYRNDKVAVILFTDEGLIRNRIISVDAALSQRDLNRIAAYISSHFSGRTLEEIRKMVVKELARETVLCDSLVEEAMRICSAVFSVSPGNVYISGLSEVLALPDFCDIDRIKELLKTIEDKHIIVKLLDKIADADGPQVIIGSENPLDEMKTFSIVAATYKEGSRPMGAVGIIGPTRMNYLQAISIVDLTATYITEMLSYK
ncbi:MAG: heat-inducible transcriptional repressor HrcA [Nitrospiraceae bacterium]|nr:heat-inducible transcriptional repressor HrcA [Nitrospiraceae bacterium]